jgi:hypothetical protein
MSALRIIGVLLTLTTAVGCVSVMAEGPRGIRKVGKGTVSGISEARQEIIRDKAAWEKLWSRHCGRTKPAEKLPDIDFAKEMVIVVTMGTQSTGGYAIEIVSVEETNQVLRISVRRTKPPKGAMTIQVLTAPFQMVTVPKSDLKPEFVEADPPRRM